jgi:Sigma-70 region 2
VAARLVSTFSFFVFFRPVLTWLKIIRARSDAEDVVQEVFLSIHEQRKRSDPSVGSARTWVKQFDYTNR